MRQFLMNHIVIPALDAVKGTHLAQNLRSLEESQWYSAEEIRVLQNEKLRGIIAHAYDTVPFYRELMDTRKLKPLDICTTDDLQKLPIIDKAMMKAITPGKTVSSAYKLEQLVPRDTSGSTGEPFHFFVSRDEKIMKRAALARFWRWGGWDFGIRFVLLFSRYHSMFSKEGLPRKIESFVMGRKFLPVKSITPAYLDEIAAFDPKIIMSFGSGMAALANLALERGVRLHLRGALTTADTLTQHHRSRIQEAFSTKVYDEYGGEDMSFMAQCEHADLYHGNAENTFIELLNNGERAAPGEGGEVVVTDLTRRAMPFIRYAMRDRVVSSTRRCPCGRELPTYERIEGREIDMLISSSGRKIPAAMIDCALHVPEVKFFQAVQTRPDALVIRIVPDKGFNENTWEETLGHLRNYVGPDFQYELELVKDVERTAAGKARIVIVNIQNAS